MYNLLVLIFPVILYLLTYGFSNTSFLAQHNVSPNILDSCTSLQKKFMLSSNRHTQQVLRIATYKGCDFQYSICNVLLYEKRTGNKNIPKYTIDQKILTYGCIGVQNGGFVANKIDW